MEDVTVILYDKSRHEIFNDVEKEQVFSGRRPVDFQQNLVKYPVNFEKSQVFTKIFLKSIDKTITICYNSGMNSLDPPQRRTAMKRIFVHFSSARNCHFPVLPVCLPRRPGFRLPPQKRIRLSLSLGQCAA